MQRQALRLLTFLLLPASATFAQQAGRTPFETPPSELAEYAAEIGAKHPDEAVVVVRLQRDIRFDADGTAHHSFHLIYRPSTDSGAEAWDEVSASWSPWRQQRPVIRARVIAPDGSQSDLDPETVAEAAASTNRDSIYRDVRALRAPLPAMKAGVVVEYVVETEGTEPLFEAGEVAKYLVNQSVPVESWRLTIDAPEALPLQYSVELAEDLKPAEGTEGGRKTFIFEAGPLDEYADPASGLPKDQPRYPAVSFATGRSWADLSAAYQRIIDEKASPAGVEEIARAAAAGLSSREEKIQALTAALHQRVRYTGLEFGKAGFIPYAPADVLERQYGDCKDKSTVLIAMLRAIGMPAYLAMLRTGPGQDIDPQLPGMGRFDHAIVYIPGEPDYWIDATAEFSRSDSPPSAVQGRYALVAQPGVGELVTIPKAPSTANRTIETRRILLSDLGKSTVVEESEYRGAAELSMRSGFDSYDPESTHESLESYVQQNYLAESLTSFDVSESADLSSPFTLQLEAEECGRGVTELKQAVVAIRLENLTTSLPEELTSTPDEDDEEDEEKRSEDYVVDVPFVLEWRYEIRPPAGFKVRELPQGERREIGPMLFTSEFSEGEDGSVSARLVFDSGRDRLTAEEVLEVQEGIEEFRASEPVMVWFDHEAEALLEAGRIREALDEMKATVAAAPDRPLPLVRLARAYLTAGLGELARTNARRAVETDPESAIAHSTLGWTLQHDLIGRRFAKGFDLDGAVAAYRRAHELEPEDDEIQLDLAILIEHDAKGIRYGKGANLAEAVEHYDEVLDRKEYPVVRTNLMAALMNSGDFDGLRKAAEEIPAKTEASYTYGVIAEAALEGVEHALRYAKDKLTNDEQRIRVLSSAAQTLIHERRYELVADLMAALARDLDNPSQALAQASLFRKTKRWEELDLDASDPSSVVARMFLAIFGEGDWRETLPELFSRHAQAEFENEKRIAELDRELKLQRAGLSNLGVPAPVVVDLMFGARVSRRDGDDDNGYIVRETYSVANQTTKVEAYVLRENGKYVLLDLAMDGAGEFTGIPYEVYARIEDGDLDGAQILLDWAREHLTPSGGDDPLLAPYFPHVWNRGDKADAKRMRYAAAALHAEGTEAEARSAVPILREAVRKAPKQDRPWFEAALTGALVVSEQWAELLPAAEALRKRYPDSEVAFSTHGLALLNLERYDDLETLARARIKDDPDHELAWGLLHNRYLKVGDWSGLRDLLQERIASGEATVGDKNNYVWGAVMAEAVDDEVIAIIEDAALAGDSTAVMHTQACAYAAADRTALAREILLQMMQAEGLDEPDSKSWYLIGRFAENYGEPEAAAAAYARVEPPKDDPDDPTSVYRLAQNGLERLGEQP